MGHSVRLFAFVVVICAGVAWVISQRDKITGLGQGPTDSGLIEQVLTDSGLTGGGLNSGTPTGESPIDSGLLRRLLTDSGLIGSGQPETRQIERGLGDQVPLGDQPNQYRVPEDPPGDEVVVAQTSRAIKLRARSNGHFYIEVQVNGARIPFLVDTGATSVMLSKEAARSARINPRRDDYSLSAQTANGTVKMAPVTLREMRVGGFRTTNVEGAVNSAKMGISLLGMSFLNRLRRYEVKGNEMLLYW